MAAVVTSVNLAVAATLPLRGEERPTGIFKEAVGDGPVRATALGLEGDTIADPEVHGGVHKAIYAYASEDSAWWAEQLDREVPPGTFGENLTTSGWDATGLRVGSRWRVGEVLVEVAGPRIPCWKLAAKMGDPRFTRTFAAAGRPGAYLRVVEDGALSAASPIEPVATPDTTLTVGQVAACYHGDASLLEAVADNPHLEDGWRDWARARLDRRRDA